MEALKGLLTDLDLGNPADPDLQSRLSNIRAKFKQVVMVMLYWEKHPYLFF
jgi:hypothetical protein